MKIEKENPQHKSTTINYDESVSSIEGNLKITVKYVQQNMFLRRDIF